MKIFATNLSALMPEGIALPSELIAAFDWLEDQGWHQTRGTGAPEEHTLLIYPPEHQNHPVASHVAFGGTTLPYTGHWSAPDPQVDARIAEIGETSGDGGRVAIWLDDNGKQQFVHIGHDSLGVITDDPLVLLQFLAMGYPEPGSLVRSDITPVAAYLEYHGVVRLEDFGPKEQPVFPVAFQGFLKERFDLDMPATARDLEIADFPEYGDDTTSDPFARWINEATPEPSEADLAYEMELMRTIEALDLKDDDSSETIMGKIGSLFKSKDNKE
ncbi:hypothetical protein [uncultured Sulfitobacter sp.]|uniref:hypothetical protein n=1 Tax=uncultured Sulfitobacter sp. TaxID=191468 RepID=UPI0026042425|nr:hypothetical protein [uncultured Sulfitobacter sp.]